MGELDEQEMIEVDRMVESHPEIQEELGKLRTSINQYAEASGSQPDKSLLHEVFKELEAPEPIEKIPLITMHQKKPFWAIAASFFLLVSIGFNIYFASELRQSRNEVKQLAAEKNVIAEQIETASQKLEYANLRIAHFLYKDNIHVRMDGLPLSPESYANVFWNKKSNAVFISVDNLPEPPHGHQYQLWAIKVNQPPIDAGIFDHNNLVQELKVIKGDVMAFAVTLEKEGGTPRATVEKTYVKGFLKKS